MKFKSRPMIYKT